MPIRATHCMLAEDALEVFLNTKTYIPVTDSELVDIPDITKRDVWEALPEDLRTHLIRAGEQTTAKPWSQLLATDYLAFSRTGDRAAFEEKYFSRRRKLTTLVMAECVEDNGRFLDDIVNGFCLIMEETGWCLPAHNGYIRDSRLYPLQDISRPVVDLFAAETAAILGVAEALLRSKLPAISSLISSNLNHLLRTRILIPYLTYHFWWMGDGESQMLNWTPWITQNVLLAIFTRQPGFASIEEQQAVLRQAAKSADYFMDEYGDDGCCSEGAQYYSHAGLCLFGCLHLLDEITHGSYREVFAAPLVHNMADYIRKMYVGNGYYINFADCSPFAGERGAREYLFAKATGNAAMASFAASDYARASWTGDEDKEGRLLTNEQNLYYHLLQTFNHTEMLAASEKAVPTGTNTKTGLSETVIPATHAAPSTAGDDSSPWNTSDSGDVWYQSVGLMIARDDHFVLAAKAGGNADAHNHNDTGSFTVYKDGQPLIIDLGVETYTKKTFSQDRYEIWTMQSAYHNLPTFGDVQQHDGAQYAASDVVCTLQKDASSLSMDIAAAYPTDRVRSYRRTASLLKEDRISVQEHYDGDLPCVCSLITYDEPIVKGDAVNTTADATTSMHAAAPADVKIDASADTVHQIQVGALATITVCGSDVPLIERLPITDARLKKAWKHDCWRILLPMKGQDLSITVR